MDKLKQLNLVYAIFVILGLRAGIMGASIGDALFLVAVVGYKGYTKWLDSKGTPNYPELFKKDMDELKNKMSAVIIRDTAKPQQQSNVRLF